MRIQQSFAIISVLVLLSSLEIGTAKDVEDADGFGVGEADGKSNATSTTVDDDSFVVETRNRSDKVREVVLSAMKVPEKREQIGEVIPIIRNMSERQKLAMATLISKRILNNDTTSPPIEEVQSLLGNGSNDDNDGDKTRNSRENATRELMLPISMDIAKILSDDTSGEEIEQQDVPEELPEAQELRAVRPILSRRPIYRTFSPKRPNLPNRRNVYTDAIRTSLKLPRRPTELRRGPTEKECTFFTKTVCLKAIDYPHEAITRSLRSNKEMVAALLTDYKIPNEGKTEEDFPLTTETKYGNRYSEQRYESNEIKRSDSPFDNVEEGFTCPSIIKYARPQLAKAASGLWKYIINTGEHTQTLRLEKCLNTRSSCSFISENYRSSCTQVYNYHRLLTWDSKLGLHMDIFKVPTCCSCHVHGYTEIFPPHEKDPPLRGKETFPGADFVTTNEQKDEYEDLGRPSSSYINKYTLGSSYDSNILSSNKKPVVEVSSSRPSLTIPSRVRAKLPVPRPYDKVPQQHAPNTRAPGYSGPLIKGSRHGRPSRPSFRRESTVQVEEYTEAPSNSSFDNRYSPSFDQEMDASSRLQNGGFDEEYQEPQRRINYNYHPIIDFFKPEASMLQVSDSQLFTQSSSTQDDSNAWKPMMLES